jgi:hypothetical protein
MRIRQLGFNVARALAAALFGVLLAQPALADTPVEMLARYATAAGAPAVAGRGELFFTTRHGHEWSCSSCHGAVPVKAGQHASTGKTIGAMAPAQNPERFTDSAKTEKWFRRNCNDVVGRECTAAEKADLLAWLMTLKG